MALTDNKISHLRRQKMNKRRLGKTNYEVSEIALGTWQLGSKWGEEFDEKEAMATLEAAYAQGINFIDTADVYKDRLSEKTIGKFLKTKKEKIYVVTKIGRRLNPHVKEGYTKENLTRFVDEALENMELNSLDLVLLHCPPTDVFYQPETFRALDELKKNGKIQHYGVSVERVEEAIKAMDYDISAVEIIFNMFRLRPDELFFKLAKEKEIGTIIRVPLASGLLTGRYTLETTFGEQDHRTYNRNGEAFDKGETFSGVDYATGVRAAEELKKIFGTDEIAPYALKWILAHDISTVIPGASNEDQVRRNVEALTVPKLSKEQMQAVKRVYEKYVKEQVHYLW